MRSMVIVIVFPLSQVLVKELDVVGNPTLIEHLIKLLIVHAMRALHFPVEVGGAWSNIHMANVFGFEMPVKL